MDFVTNKCTTITVVSKITIKGKSAVEVKCSKCSLDIELFPRLITTIGNLKNGTYPCGCSIKRWNKSQYKILVERSASLIDSSVVSCEAVKTSDKVLLRCNCCGTERIQSLSKLIYEKSRTGCVKCLNEKTRSRLTIKEPIIDIKSMGLELIERCEDSNDGSKSEYWNVRCLTCSYDDYVINNLCDGIFRTTIGNLRKGFKPCRCNKNYQLNNEQKLLMLKKIRKDINVVSCDKDNDKVTFECEKHGLVTQSLTAFQFSGSGCSKCAIYGFNPSIDSYIYFLRSKFGVKVGITNYPKQRINQLKKSTPFNFDVVSVYKGSGDDVRFNEKELHLSNKSCGFTGFSGATEWLVIDSNSDLSVNPLLSRVEI